MIAARVVAWVAVLLAVAATVLAVVAFWDPVDDRLPIYFAAIACWALFLAGVLFGRARDAGR